jgi:hypothetical protein
MQFERRQSLRCPSHWLKVKAIRACVHTPAHLVVSSPDHFCNHSSRDPPTLQTALPTVPFSGSAPSLERSQGVPATGSRRRIAGRCRQHKTLSLVAPLIPARVEEHGEDEQADGQQNHSYHTRPHQSEFTPGLTTSHYTASGKSLERT